ncbi:MAG: hypothetical protein GWM87_04115 [Xanthomonadales bacterium]|nr:hypothetical protein [Xanthomonadales bacterium]NIX12211.1 hypothetical protein [Xanthomonadales bacterium]
MGGGSPPDGSPELSELSWPWLLESDGGELDGSEGLEGAPDGVDGVDGIGMEGVCGCGSWQAARMAAMTIENRILLAFTAMLLP